MFVPGNFSILVTILEKLARDNTSLLQKSVNYGLKIFTIQAPGVNLILFPFTNTLKIPLGKTNYIKQALKIWGEREITSITSVWTSVFLAWWYYANRRPYGKYGCWEVGFHPPENLAGDVLLLSGNVSDEEIFTTFTPGFRLMVEPLPEGLKRSTRRSSLPGIGVAPWPLFSKAFVIMAFSPNDDFVLKG